MSGKKPIAIDLFCGVGGMSLGFKQAGFRVVGAFDAEERHVLTYKKNFPKAPAVTVDLREVSGSDLLTLVGWAGEVDVVFGGPPCQGFSVGGKRDADDERNQLIFDFIRLVRDIKPKYFVMENVQGLLLGHAVKMLDSLVHRAKLAGYRVVEKVRALDASEFGVPQRRKRTFVMGWRSDVVPVDYPDAAPITNESGLSYYPRVRDAIADLPVIEDHEELFERDGYKGPLGPPSHYARIMRGEIKEPSDKLPLRKCNGHGLTGCLRTRHTEESIARFMSTKPGKAEPVSRFHRLKHDSFAPTIRAGTGSDRGSHTSPRAIHPDRPRCITVREAARLQSYPDWFEFDSTRWHAFRQIGNSVPPRLARVVAGEVIKALDRQSALAGNSREPCMIS